MKIIPKLLVSRITIVVLLILAQLVLIGLTVTYLAEYFPIYYTITLILATIMTVNIINTRENPAFKIAWLVLILVMPPFGTAMYYIFSGSRISKAVKRRLSGMYSGVNTDSLKRNEASLSKTSDVDAASQSLYISRASSFPPYSATDVKYLPVGEEFHKSLLESLEKAERFIFLEYFIISKGAMWDSIHEILRRKVRLGVDVRVIYDDMGCITLLDDKFRRSLEREGIKTAVFNRFIPILSARLNNRDHRKICVIDGNIGFTGGINIGDEYINRTSCFGHWKDNAVKLEGEAVRSLTLMFLTMWNALSDKRKIQDVDISKYAPTISSEEGEGIVQPYTDNPLDDEQIGELIYLNMIYSAKDYLWITTPYLIIDYSIEQALCSAAKRGVDVRIVVPGIPDKKVIYEATKSCYPSLIKAGVKIYEYTPGFVHAKTFLCDDKIATVGTVNLDFRSLYLHLECGAWMYLVPAIKDIKADFRDMFKVSEEVTEEKCKVSALRGAFRSVIKLIAPLF